MSDPPLPPLQSVRLLDPVRERIRYVHCSLRTERACVHWVAAFVRFHGMGPPREMGLAEARAFLSWPAGERSVAVSTHRQALLGRADGGATMIYTHVLEVGGGAVRSPLDMLSSAPAGPFVRAVPPARPPRSREPAPCHALLRRFPATPSFTAAATSAS